MAFAFKREGPKFGRGLEIGVARAEGDGMIRIFLDRLPIGGLSARRAVGAYRRRATPCPSRRRADQARLLRSARPLFRQPPPSSALSPFRNGEHAVDGIRRYVHRTAKRVVERDDDDQAGGENDR
jgi:hypothetical protein